MAQCDRFSFWLRLALPWVMAIGVTPPVLAHGGHGAEFARGKTNSGQEAISIDPVTAQRAGILVAPITPKSLEIGLAATGQLELAADRQSLITAPVSGKVVALLVEPGATVQAGQPLATITSAELADLRVSTQTKRSELWADVQQAQASWQLATTNYQRYRTIAAAELRRAQDSLTAAQAQYNRDRDLVKSQPVVKAAQENYQRQLAISRSEIAQAQTEVALAQERYTQDQRLGANGALPQRQVLESQAALVAARTKLTKAQQQPEAVAARTALRQAEVDLPARNQQESASRLAEARASLITASTSKEVVAAEAELRRTQIALNASKTQYELADRAYITRLQQLGTAADGRGFVTIKAPIGGTVSKISATLGQTLAAGETQIMEVVDDRQILVTANIYERDLANVSPGQGVNLQVASLPGQKFTGTVSRIGTRVGEERVIPVQALLENGDRRLKAGMFATVELITGTRTQPVLAVPNSALVNANGQKILYVRSGNRFQGVTVTTGRTAGDLVEVKTGLFAGDQVVVQGATSLYGQSLRSNSGENPSAAPHSTPNFLAGLGVWPLVATGAGGLALGGLGVAIWKRRRPGQLDMAIDMDIDRVITAVVVEEDEDEAPRQRLELLNADRRDNAIPYHPTTHHSEDQQSS
jgi:membrane fusion protein, heavy metal efflux system